MTHPATVVYTKPACVQCDRTKIELDLRGVEYNLVDLTEDAIALAYVKNYLGYTGAPVVQVMDETGTLDHWYGMNPIKINEHFGPKPAATEAAS